MSIDHSTGRASLIDGALFYSPNCSRTVKLPVAIQPNRYIFKHHDIRLQDYFEPLWWSEPYGWLSFIPMNPSFIGAPFHHLNCIPVIERPPDAPETHPYKLHGATIQRWRRLEDALLHATSLLPTACEAVALRPIPPWLLGYNRSHKTTRIARDRAIRARDWFVVWMGLFSYIIACGRSTTSARFRDPELPPKWYEILVEANFSQTWLNSISSSIVCSFSAHTRRTGIFVDWLVRDLKRPRVEWFCNYHVPVWYPWTPSHAKAARENPEFAYLQPPVEALQAVSSFLVQSLQPPLPSPPPRVPKAPKKAPKLTWQEFFTRREKIHAEKEPNLSQKDRQRHASRAKDRPIGTATVYRWVQSDEDETVLVRQRVSNRFKEEVMEEYGYRQRRYDPWENEWDLCEEFGDDDTASDNSDSDLDLDAVDHPHGLAPEFEFDLAEVNEYVSSRRFAHSPPPPAYSGDEASAHERMEDAPETSPLDFLDILAYHYGFVPPLTDIASDPSDAQNWLNGVKALGYLAETVSAPTTSLRTAVVQFIQRLAKKERPRHDEWDLSEQNRKALAYTFPLNTIHQMGDLYAFPAAHNVLNWVLALTNAADALYVARLFATQTPPLTVYEVARLLLEQGIAFFTLKALERTPTFNPSDNIFRLIPIRLSGYTFTPSDYTDYVRQRAAILTSPRGRAALLRGGLMWRLAKEDLSLDAVLQGPSNSVTIHRFGFSVPGGSSNADFWDDNLTEDEVWLICGVYRCFTGNGKQIALKSWWPLPTAWHGTGSGMDYGRWTPFNKEWFQARRTQIQQGAQPLPTNKWRDKLRGQAQARLVRINTRELSKHVLSSHMS